MYNLHFCVRNCNTSSNILEFNFIFYFRIKYEFCLLFHRKVEELYKHRFPLGF